MGVEFWVLTSPILSGLAAHGYTGINSSSAANTADSSSVFDECRDPDPSVLTKPARHTLENLDHHGDVLGRDGQALHSGIEAGELRISHTA
jgi:hypothetical protein